MKTEIKKELDNLSYTYHDVYVYVVYHNDHLKAIFATEEEAKDYVNETIPA